MGPPASHHTAATFVDLLEQRARLDDALVHFNFNKGPLPLKRQRARAGSRQHAVRKEEGSKRSDLARIVTANDSM